MSKGEYIIMQTSLEKVKTTAKILCDSIKIEPIMSTLCNHPFTDSTIDFQEMMEGKSLSETSLTNPDVYDKWKKKLFKQIDKAKNAEAVYMLVRSPYKLTFLKFIKDYLSQEDFADLLADAWVCQENPNMDVNVSVRTVASWFRAADKQNLMVEEDYQYWENLPEEFMVYRGVAPTRTKLGLSWTDDKKTADWFAKRFTNIAEGESYMLSALIKKEEALAYFNTRNEKEVIVDPYKLKGRITEVIL